MCESCNSGHSPNWEADFLSRYLKEQQSRLENEGHNPEVKAEVEKTKWLLDNIHTSEEPGC